MSGGENDLYVVGAGYLGKIIGEKWGSKHPEAKMYGETRSYTRHETFMPPGMTHVMRKNREEEGVKCPNVVFCANPGGNKDYAREVFTAMEDVWDGTGMFVFTSSGSVYGEKDGGVVTEDSPIDEAKVNSPLRIAELVTLDGGGCVVRLAGLYSAERGPHSVWLKEKRGKINLVSYKDAASAVVAALQAGINQIKDVDGAPGVKGKVFLAADHSPTTRRKICKVALEHPIYFRRSMPKFTQDATPPEFAVTGARKVYDSSATRRVLGWEPEFPSIEEYFRIELEELEESERRAEEKAAAEKTAALPE
ncbi:Contains domains for prephenate dehydrogenase and nucleoside-diphosphate-sugar epimerases [Ectocarpus siliculosus]|uniref:Contains domains for prephenate dehydrogenase and nucleoside-diphosphate-sugar epimerases n=1 Tax=Ectocarpus siliculosus TaxID=2880 RepID=D7FTF3_ECTSI|nr:Contains domains for prephenate dehydrogenase and nucleoside-diphosphate-sugar epimerases [Ectocarpus siliculosus]|eukprot:CBJ48531.1 Contains domains for prephenate dehydrogenase and nucleoside-diphosphate-sugar epimerases [Ectocarpus siliculosus]